MSKNTTLKCLADAYAERKYMLPNKHLENSKNLFKKILKSFSKISECIKQLLINVLIQEN